MYGAISIQMNIYYKTVPRQSPLLDKLSAPVSNHLQESQGAARCYDLDIYRCRQATIFPTLPSSGNSMTRYMETYLGSPQYLRSV
jgi:hypothetical protein